MSSTVERVSIVSCINTRRGAERGVYSVAKLVCAIYDYALDTSTRAEECTCQEPESPIIGKGGPWIEPWMGT